MVGGRSNLLFKPLAETPTGPVHATYMHAVGVFNGTAALVTTDDELIIWQPGETDPAPVGIVRNDLAPRPYLPVRDVSFSPDGQTIAIARQAADTISLWRRDGSFISELEGGRQAKFTPDGRHLVTSAGAGVLALWDWRTGTRIATSSVTGATETMLAMEFSRQGNWLATGHEGARGGGKVCVWKVAGESIQLINEFERGGNIEDLCFTMDEQWVVAGDVTGVQLHHVSTGATRKMATSSVRGVEVTRDGKRIVTSNGDMIRFWDLETGERMGSFDTSAFVSTIRFLDEYRLLYVVRGVGARILDVKPE